MESILKDSGHQIFKVNGNKGIGKTRFIKFIAQSLYQRGLFSDGVYFLDFEKVESQNQINDLFKGIGIEFMLQN